MAGLSYFISHHYTYISTSVRGSVPLSQSMRMCSAKYIFGAAFAVGNNHFKLGHPCCFLWVTTNSGFYCVTIIHDPSGRFNFQISIFIFIFQFLSKIFNYFAKKLIWRASFYFSYFHFSFLIFLFSSFYFDYIWLSNVGQVTVRILD